MFYVSEDQLQAAATSLGEAGFGLIRHEHPYWANAGAGQRWHGRCRTEAAQRALKYRATGRSENPAFS